MADRFAKSIRQMRSSVNALARCCSTCAKTASAQAACQRTRSLSRARKSLARIRDIATRPDPRNPDHLRHRPALSARRTDIARAGLSECRFRSRRLSALADRRIADRRRRTIDAAMAERYARQLVLPEVGVQGQKKLAGARVALIGAGGLGSPAALYLAAAGVGTLSLIDDDRVERSNLQRQVLHTDARMGMHKTESARIALGALNPDVALQLHEERLRAANVEALVRDHDVVIDGADNFPTRYLLNAACRSPEDSARLWRGAPVHRPSQRVRSAARRFAVLSMPVSRTAIRRRSAELQRSGSARRAARRHRPIAGDRGDQACARHRRAACRTLALLRRARRGIPRAADFRAIRRVPVAAADAVFNGYEDLERLCAAAADALRSACSRCEPFR